MRVSGVQARVLICLVLFVTATVTSALQFMSSGTAYAAQITARSLQLQQHTAITTGGSAPGGVADHKFSFTVPSATTVQSVQFLYCTTATGTCTMPTGLVTTSATYTGGAGLTTGWSIVNTTNGAPYITHSGAVSVAGADVGTVLNVTNPTATNSTFFVRITTFTSADATTGSTDAGVVAASTATTITVTGTMPEYIQFCTGASITVNSGIPDCTSAVTGAVTFNQEFSPSDTATATSMMAASTNASSGYVITLTGTTLTAGSNTIPTVGTTAIAFNTARGTSKFGLNLVANTTTTSTVAVGANINPTSNGSNLRGLPSTGYATADMFALDLTGATALAKSDNTTPGTPAPTDAQAYTVSYVVDVAGSQPPGTYVATLNYVCTATF
jgi:hypothetical protein